MSNEIIETLRKNNGNVVKTARDLNVSRGSVRAAAEKAYCDSIRTVEKGQVISGISTLYKYEDENGEKILEWVKTKTGQKEQLDAIRVAVNTLLEDLPRADVVERSPGNLYEDELHLITITDLHVGMYAWHEETGADWDLDGCEQTVNNAVRHLVDKSKSRLGLLNLQGDFLHYSGLESKTELHGHLLDADSRQPKMIRTAVRIIRNAVKVMLKKHEMVIISVVPGNHDMSATAYLATMLDLLYENEPRVSVMNNPQPYKVYLHGKTFLGFSHGHLKKMPGMSELFAGKFYKEFGETEHRYLHCGHMHHEKVTENSMFKIVQHATIAAPDAYAANGGWLSKRQIRSITYHKEFGEIANAIVRPEMVIK